MHHAEPTALILGDQHQATSGPLLGELFDDALVPGLARGLRAAYDAVFGQASDVGGPCETKEDLTNSHGWPSTLVGRRCPFAEGAAMLRWVASLSFFLMGALLSACGSHATTSSSARGSATPLESASVGRGRAVYAAQCATCHGDAGGGGQIGPPLRGEHLRRKPAYIADAIANPTPPMPKLEPAQMSRQDLLDVTAFVQQL